MKRITQLKKTENAHDVKLIIKAHKTSLPIEWSAARKQSEKLLMIQLLEISESGLLIHAPAGFYEMDEKVEIVLSFSVLEKIHYFEIPAKVKKISYEERTRDWDSVQIEFASSARESDGWRIFLKLINKKQRKFDKLFFEMRGV